MDYQSTRDSALRVSSAQAITSGISSEGGLFVPAALPSVTAEEIRGLCGKSYTERAAFILERFLTDFSREDIIDSVEKAYTAEKFGSDAIAPLAHLYQGTYILELWHGPTCAFKDMALQILPLLLTKSARMLGIEDEIVILVATSGDTGKAALEGFKDVPDTRMMVFYPQDGVSAMQKRQMTTQEGGNVAVCAIEGNFDDAQTGVKRLFTDEGVKHKLSASGKRFSSANSINWGRLVPQIIYYFSAYCELVENGEIEQGEQINVVVPTGNFGNILAAYYAKQMGLPIKKLICASNANNVLTDFIRTGVYDRNRGFHATISPSMDILISSNLERLLYELTGRDDEKIRRWFGQLSQSGRYEVDEDVKAKLQELFAAGCCDDDQTRGTIREIFEQYSYLCDTHTAVAVKVYEDYRRETGDMAKTIIASTASPYKFSASVLSALGADVESADEFEKVRILSRVSGTQAPQSLLSLQEKQVRFDGCIQPSQMQETVYGMLGIRE